MPALCYATCLSLFIDGMMSAVPCLVWHGGRRFPSLYAMPACLCPPCRHDLGWNWAAVQVPCGIVSMPACLPNMCLPPCLLIPYTLYPTTYPNSAWSPLPCPFPLPCLLLVEITCCCLPRRQEEQGGCLACRYYLLFNAPLPAIAQPSCPILRFIYCFLAAHTPEKDLQVPACPSPRSGGYTAPIWNFPNWEEGLWKLLQAEPCIPVPYALFSCFR